MVKTSHEKCTLCRGFGKYYGTFTPTCADGIQNQNETGVDAGGICDTSNALLDNLTGKPFDHETAPHWEFTPATSGTLVSIMGYFSNNTRGLQHSGAHLEKIDSGNIIDLDCDSVEDVNFNAHGFYSILNGWENFSGAQCDLVAGERYMMRLDITQTGGVWVSDALGLYPNVIYYTAASTPPINQPTCSDGIQNQDETGIDTGGVCQTLSSEKNLITFTFPNLNPPVDSTIYGDHAVNVNVPFGTDVRAMTPTIAISDKATVSPASGLAQDFSNPIVYTVTAEDGSTQDYTVTVVPSCVTDCFSSVMFFPGLMGSKLYEANADCDFAVSPDCHDRELWISLANPEQEKLALDANGKTINSIFTKDDTQKLDGDGGETGLADEIYGFNIYKSFIADLKKWKDESTIADYAFIPYDWRLSLEDIITNGRTDASGNLSYTGSQDFSESFILKKLQALAESSRTGKVTLIAHSNGGLVVKALIQKLQDTGNPLYDQIDKIIFVAVPQIGTPDAVVSLLHGTDLGYGFIMGNDRSRELSENMPTVYNLLPSSAYFTTVSPGFAVDQLVSFENKEFFNPQTSQYGVYVGNAAELKSYILGTDGRTKPSFSDTLHPNIGNPGLYQQAETVHQILDAWTPSPNTKVIQIAGWGEETIAGLDYKTHVVDILGGEDISYKPRMVIDGDGTVVAPSALWMPTSANVERWWVDLNEYNKKVVVPRNHRDVLEVSNLRNFIKSEIVNTSLIDSENIITNSNAGFTSNDSRLHFTLHSPLTIGITDSQGRYTGMDPVTKEIKQEIPGVIYKQIGELQFISVPAGVAYTLKLQGYSDGTFALDVDKQTGDAVTDSVSFDGITNSTLTLATMDVAANSTVSNSELKIDQDGNGSVDKTYHIVDGEAELVDTTSKVTGSGPLITTENPVIAPSPTSEEPKIETPEIKENKIEEIPETLENIIVPENPSPNTNESVVSVIKNKLIKKAAVAPKKSSNLAIQNKPQTQINPASLSASAINSGASTGFWGIIKKIIYNIFH